MLTHQVHDEVQLDGEVDDEEDTGPGVPGVGGHHHIWETGFAEHDRRALPLLSPILHLPRRPLSFLPSRPHPTFPSSPSLGFELIGPPPSPGTRLCSGVEHSWLKRKDPGALAEGPSPSPAHTHLAVVRRTNRLTMLFSSVLKYCKERRQKMHWHQEQAAMGHLERPSLPLPPPSSQGLLRRTEEGANVESSRLRLPELRASGRSRQLTGTLFLENHMSAPSAWLPSTAPSPTVPDLILETCVSRAGKGIPSALKERSGSSRSDRNFPAP